MRTLFVLLSLLMISGCANQTETDTQPGPTAQKETMTEIPYTSDSLDTIKQAVADGSAILLDVRSQEEWDAGHLKVAEFIPTAWFTSDDPALASAVEKLDKSKPIYIHCKMGGRAGMCAQSLGAMGYDARPMKVEYTSIVESGFEEVK